MRSWHSGPLVAVASALLGVIAGTSLGGTAPAPTSQAAAPPQLQFIRVDRDQTLTPRRTTTTTVLCPRTHFMLAWNLSPTGPRQRGVISQAVLRGAVPVIRRGGGAAGFTITLQNPNQGATIRMRVSVSCLGGRGLAVGVYAGAPFPGGQARPARTAAREPRRPGISLDGVRKRVTVRTGARATRVTLLCGDANSAPGDFGFSPGGGVEIAAALPVRSRGRAGLRLEFRRPAAPGRPARSARRGAPATASQLDLQAYLTCLEGRDGLQVRAVVGGDSVPKPTGTAPTLTVHMQAVPATSVGDGETFEPRGHPGARLFTGGPANGSYVDGGRFWGTRALVKHIDEASAAVLRTGFAHRSDPEMTSGVPLPSLTHWLSDLHASNLRGLDDLRDLTAPAPDTPPPPPAPTTTTTIPAPPPDGATTPEFSCGFVFVSEMSPDVPGQTFPGGQNFRWDCNRDPTSAMIALGPGEPATKAFRAFQGSGSFDFSMDSRSITGDPKPAGELKTGTNESNPTTLLITFRSGDNTSMGMLTFGQPPPSGPRCANSSDDDADGLIDANDPGCTSHFDQSGLAVYDAQDQSERHLDNQVNCAQAGNTQITVIHEGTTLEEHMLVNADTGSVLVQRVKSDPDFLSPSGGVVDIDSCTGANGSLTWTVTGKTVRYTISVGAGGSGTRTYRSVGNTR